MSAVSMVETPRVRAPAAFATSFRRAFSELTAIDGAEAPGEDELLPAGPRILPRATLRALGAVTERLFDVYDSHVRAALANNGATELARTLGFSARETAVISAATSLLPSPVRADFVPTRGGYRLVEWNVDPCLGGFAAQRLFACYELAGGARGLELFDPAAALGKSLARVLPITSRLVVALLGAHASRWETNAARIAEVARAAGLDARVVTLEEAVTRAEASTPDAPLAVLRMFHLEHVPAVAELVARLLVAVRTERAHLVYGFETELWGDKQWLARVKLPPALARYVPATHAASEVAKELCATPGDWVLKPHAGAAGEGVTVGREATADAWRAAVHRATQERGWVAQRLVVPRETRLAYLDRNGAVTSRREVETLGIFLIDGRFAGAYVRSKPAGEGVVVDGASSFNVVVTRRALRPIRPAPSGDVALPPDVRRPWAAVSVPALRRRLRSFETLALEHLAARGGKHVGASPEHAGAAFGGATLPEEGTPLATIVRDLRADLAPFCHDKRDPKYVAHLDVPPADLSIASGVLIRALAQDPVTWTSSKAGTFVEQEVVRWLTALAFPRVASARGVPCAGGTQANLHAVLLARNLALGRLGYDVGRLGVGEALRRSGARRLIVVAAASRHGSLSAAVRHAGLGTDNLVEIAVDREGAIRIDALEEALEEARRAGDLVALVSLAAGTVGVGTVDALPAAIELARRYEARVHVDAAHGAMLLFSRRYRGRLAGLELADSVTADPHKILGMNQGLGMLLLRDGADREALTKDPAPYFVAPRGAPVWSSYTLDGTRPLNALAAWVLLRHLGRAGYERIVDHLLSLTARFVDGVTAGGRFELFAKPAMNLVGFRTPGGDAAAVTRLLAGAAREGYRAGAYQSDRGAYARAVFVNPATTGFNVDELVRVLAECA